MSCPSLSKGLKAISLPVTNAFAVVAILMINTSRNFNSLSEYSLVETDILRSLSQY
jgi:hypothetical protein